MQYINSTIQYHEDTRTAAAAIERGDCVMSHGVVQGYGVWLEKNNRNVLAAPVSREVAEKVLGIVSGKYPGARIIKVVMDAEHVAETQEHSPGDHYFIDYFMEYQPGQWGKYTDAGFAGLDEARREAESLKAAGFVAVQIRRDRAARAEAESQNWRAGNVQAA